MSMSNTKLNADPFITSLLFFYYSMKRMRRITKDTSIKEINKINRLFNAEEVKFL